MRCIRFPQNKWISAHDHAKSICLNFLMQKLAENQLRFDDTNPSRKKLIRRSIRDDNALAVLIRKNVNISPAVLRSNL